MSRAVVSLSQARRKAARSDDDAPPPPAGPHDIDAATCPVQPLGTRANKYFFFGASGELLEMTAQHLGQGAQLISLFAGDKAWPVANFPQLDKEGAPTGWFSARGLGAWLVAECHAKGLFGGGEPERDIGVWRTPAGVAVHLGHEVWLGARRQRAGFRAWGALWPARPRCVLPDDEPATAAMAAMLEGAFQRWHWLQPEAPKLFFGAYAAGLLGAAIRWRPHILVVGAAGTGKSTLMETYLAASPLAESQNDYTEAGLRQALNSRARPALLDEAEGDLDGANKLRKVIGLLRLASGGAGAQSLKGSPEGHAKRFEVIVAAVLGGILPPALDPQDATRITRLDLRPRRLNGHPLPNEAFQQELRDMAPALWARALAGIPRFEAALARLRVEIMARGCTPRLADQLGTILAARHMMLSDADLAAGEEQEICDEFELFLPPEIDQRQDDGPIACLHHLLQSPSRTHRNGEQPSLGSIVQRARQDFGMVDSVAANASLQAHGLKLARRPARDPSAPLCLLVADRHTLLETIFANTRWAGRRWREDLLRLPDACPDNLRIDMIKQRCTVIPAIHLPEKDPDD